MSDIVALLGTFAAGAASGAGAMYLWVARAKALARPIPMPRPAEPVPKASDYGRSPAMNAVEAERRRSPFAPKPRSRHWLAEADAALDTARSKIEPAVSTLPSVGWGKPDAK